MKILYISPEHTVGALSIWKEEHERRGNECRYVTLFRSAGGFEEDICLDLPFISTGKIYDTLRRIAYRSHGDMGPETEKEGHPPVWKPANFAESVFFRLREFFWKGIIERSIKKYDLLNFDIYHLEWGMEFYRDGRFAKKLKTNGKNIVCTYHGQDMRNRGVIPEIDELSDLNLTSELDLMYKHPEISYLFLPFDTTPFKPRPEINELITVSHATTNRLAKGSDDIIDICQKLENEGKIKFILVENKPHSEVMEAKAHSDIYIDQISDMGWGYGMNSVEALSMGVVCVTKMNKTYEKFIPDHPFVNADKQNLKTVITDLAGDRKRLRELSITGNEWVKKYHDTKNVADKLYEHYERLGWLKK